MVNYRVSDFTPTKKGGSRITYHNINYCIIIFGYDIIKSKLEYS